MLQSNPKPCRIKNVKEGGTELWCEGLTIKEYSLRGRTVGYCIRFHWWHICLCCCVTPFSSILTLPLLCTICIVQGVRKCHMTVTVTRVCVYIVVSVGGHVHCIPVTASLFIQRFGWKYAHVYPQCFYCYAVFVRCCLLCVAFILT